MSYASTHVRPPLGPPVVLSAQNTTLTNLERAVAFCCLAGSTFTVPLFEAVGRDELAFTILRPEHAAPLSRIDKTNRPSIIVLGDDADETRLGPAGWSCAARVLRWSAAVMIYGAVGQVQHYETAVQSAKQFRRIALVETCSWRVPEWQALAAHYVAPRRILEIMPDAGQFHPDVQTAGGVQ